MYLVVISDDDLFLEILKNSLDKNKIIMKGVDINQGVLESNCLTDLTKKTILVKLNKETPANILKVDRIINQAKGVRRIYALNSLGKYEDQFVNVAVEEQNHEKPGRVSLKRTKGITNHSDFFISNLINYNLSKRETDVILLISGGYSYKEVASQLDLSIDTVRTHIKNVYSKLNVNSKSQAISKVMGYFISN